MKKILLLSAAMLAMMAAQQAAAFQMDNDNSTPHGMARFSDPDDNLPVAHLDDNGTMQPAQQPSQQGSTSGMSFGITPADNSGNGFQYGRPSSH